MAKLLYPTVAWNGKTVALDDGHGLYTKGKETPYIEELGRKVKENEFNEAVVDLLAGMLRAAGFQVLIVAPTDYDTSLSERVKAANAHDVDIYVSIHYNALYHEFDYSTASGVSIHIYTGQTGKESGDLAECIAKYLKGGTAQKWRGVREDNFQVLRTTNMPAILSENGFMDDEFEASLMLKPEYQLEVASEHFYGIMEYFGFALESHEAQAQSQEEGLTMSEFKGMLQNELKEMREHTVSDWARKDWEEVQINGYFDGSAPKAFLTRQEAAVVINRLRDNFKTYIKKTVEDEVAKHVEEKHADPEA
jgi:N-acetylmuramoyl-L-alanine amidase